MRKDFFLSIQVLFLDLCFFLISVEDVKGFELLSTFEGSKLTGGKEGIVQELQGVPWNDHSCSVDALVQFNILLADLLPDEYPRPEQLEESIPDILRRANEVIVAFVKTRLAYRKKDEVEGLRDYILGLLNSQGITLGQNTFLEVRRARFRFL